MLHENRVAGLNLRYETGPTCQPFHPERTRRASSWQIHHLLGARLAVAVRGRRGGGRRRGRRLDLAGALAEVVPVVAGARPVRVACFTRRAVVGSQLPDVLRQLRLRGRDAARRGDIPEFLDGFLLHVARDVVRDVVDRLAEILERVHGVVGAAEIVHVGLDLVWGQAIYVPSRLVAVDEHGFDGGPDPFRRGRARPALVQIRGHAGGDQQDDILAGAIGERALAGTYRIRVIGQSAGVMQAVHRRQDVITEVGFHARIGGKVYQGEPLPVLPELQMVDPIDGTRGELLHQGKILAASAQVTI